jgi:plasmid stabilization system protein ParE
VKPHRYHSEAETELLEQVSYYEAVSTGLGARFLAEVEAAMALAGEFPKSGSPYYSKTRRVFPKGFPYSLAYFERNTELIVMAVASFSQQPGYWRNRRRET